MHFDKHCFDRKCQEIVEDVAEKKVTSSAWAWMSLGAISALLLSCVRKKRPVSRPVMASYTKVGGDNGFVERKRNS